MLVAEIIIMLTWPLLCLHSWLIPELSAVQLQSGKESLSHTSTPTLVTRSWFMCNHTQSQFPSTKSTGSSHFLPQDNMILSTLLHMLVYYSGCLHVWYVKVAETI